MKVFGAVIIILSFISTQSFDINLIYELKKASRCGENVTSDGVIRKYYQVLHARKYNWFEALNKCRRMGFDLLTIDDQHEMNSISNFLKARGYNDDWFWISGNDLAVENHFVAVSTGHPMPYVSWLPGQPDNAGNLEDCVHLWGRPRGFLMNDWQCTQPAYAICEKITDEPIC